MPASLFTEWAGLRVVTAEIAVAPAAEIAADVQAGMSAGLGGIDLVTEMAGLPIIAALGPQEPAAGNSGNAHNWPGVTEKREQNQSGNRGNASNAEYRLSVGIRDADDPIAWRGLFARRVAHRLGFPHRSRTEAERLAYNECILCWHRRYGARAHAGRCAGCGEVLISETFDVGDGARVHHDSRRSCLTRYGHFWRSAAVAGLSALGLDPPSDFELL